MAHSYQGLTCVVTGLPLDPGDVIIHAEDDVYGVKADVWRKMGKNERQQLRDALIPNDTPFEALIEQDDSAPAVKPVRESKRGGDVVPPADNQQGS